MKKSYDITVTGLDLYSANIIAKPRTEAAKAWFASLFGSAVESVTVTKSQFHNMITAAQRQKLSVQQY
jgi:hypothetical protein